MISGMAGRRMRRGRWEYPVRRSGGFYDQRGKKSPRVLYWERLWRFPAVLLMRMLSTRSFVGIAGVCSSRVRTGAIGVRDAGEVIQTMKEKDHENLYTGSEQPGVGERCM